MPIGWWRITARRWVFSRVTSGRFFFSFLRTKRAEPGDAHNVSVRSEAPLSSPASWQHLVECNARRFEEQLVAWASHPAAELAHLTDWLAVDCTEARWWSRKRALWAGAELQRRRRSCCWSRSRSRSWERPLLWLVRGQELLQKRNGLRSLEPRKRASNGQWNYNESSLMKRKKTRIPGQVSVRSHVILIRITTVCC